jgi:hypothetical protein
VNNALPNPGPLTVLIDGQPVGTVTVYERYPCKVFGLFTPGSALQPYQSVFESAMELDRQFGERSKEHGCDDVLWDQLMAAYDEIHRLGPVFAELPAPIKEFAVETGWLVEVTFEVEPTEPEAAPEGGGAGEERKRGEESGRS